MLHRPASPKPGPLSRSAGSGHVPITAASRSAGRSRTWCTTDLSTRLDKGALQNNLPATEPHHKPISALRGRSDEQRMSHNDLWLKRIS